MKTHILIFLGFILISFYSSLSAQNDSLINPIAEDPIPIFEEIYSDGPPCGIPCKHIYDESGNFVDCMSPCCNCRELFGNSLDSTELIIFQAHPVNRCNSLVFNMILYR
jgi:hypothetical protein